MDPLDCQLTHTPAPAPRAAYVNSPVIARPAPVDLQETPGAQTRRWNRALRLCLRLYAATCVRQLSVRYQAPLPSGPAIIALNHANVTDVFLLPSIFPGDICCLAQANLFDIPIIGQVLRRAGQLPVVRGQPAALLEAAAHRLRHGYSIAVCPEGRLNHGGPLHRAGVGTVRLALHTGYPIVPVGFYVAERHAQVIRATVDGRATHGRWQVGGACHVAIGRPWWPRPDWLRRDWPWPMADGDGNYRLLRRLTDQLMLEIAALVRQAETSAAE